MHTPLYVGMYLFILVLLKDQAVQVLDKGCQAGSLAGLHDGIVSQQ